MTTHTRIVNYTVELFAPSAANESDPDPLLTLSADDQHVLHAAVLNHLHLTPDDDPEIKLVLNDPDTRSSSYHIMSNGKHVATAVIYVNG